jgi:hypothetical protein
VKNQVEIYDPYENNIPTFELSFSEFVFRFWKLHVFGVPTYAITSTQSNNLGQRIQL